MNNYYTDKAVKWSPESIIKDALNQFWQFNLIKGFVSFDSLKTDWIPRGELLSLENYILIKYGPNDVKIREIINNFSPDVFIKYDSLIEELKSKELTSIRFSQILEESMSLVG